MKEKELSIEKIIDKVLTKKNVKVIMERLDEI